MRKEKCEQGSIDKSHETGPGAAPQAVDMYTVREHFVGFKGTQMIDATHIEAGKEQGMVHGIATEKVQEFRRRRWGGSATSALAGLHYRYEYLGYKVLAQARPAGTIMPLKDFAACCVVCGCVSFSGR